MTGRAYRAGTVALLVCLECSKSFLYHAREANCATTRRNHSAPQGVSLFASGRRRVRVRDHTPPRQPLPLLSASAWSRAEAWPILCSLPDCLWVCRVGWLIWIDAAVRGPYLSNADGWKTMVMSGVTNPPCACAVSRRTTTICTHIHLCTCTLQT